VLCAAIEEKVISVFLQAFPARFAYEPDGTGFTVPPKFVPQGEIDKGSETYDSFVRSQIVVKPHQFTRALHKFTGNWNSGGLIQLG
jgi:hypothetical protein